MNIIKNPILKGFNPDPSILRVGDDYYIATSTFEWFPGVQIHHSRDLVNWRLLTRPLNRASQLNMLGDPDSCGVWAPSASQFLASMIFCSSNSAGGRALRRVLWKPSWRGNSTVSVTAARCLASR